MTAAAFVLTFVLLTAQTEPNSMPANAVKIDEQTYKVKEKDGKTWVYRKTPFGLSRVAEEQFRKAEDAALIKPSTEANVRVTDLGDEYRFERAHPFGVQAWKKKKSELTSDEKSYIEKTPAGKSGTAAGPSEKKN